MRTDIYALYMVDFSGVRDSMVIIAFKGGLHSIAVIFIKLYTSSSFVKSCPGPWDSAFAVKSDI